MWKVLARDRDDGNEWTGSAGRGMFASDTVLGGTADGDHEETGSKNDFQASRMSNCVDVDAT